MANRYWVGGNGTWDGSSTTNWSATSGGAGGASVPGASDAVIFDSNSGTGVVTLIASPTIISIDFSTANVELAGSSAGMTVSGNVILGASCTYTVTCNIIINGGICTFTSNGKTWLGNISATNGCTLNLGDDLSLPSINSLSIVKGTFNTQNHNITVGRFGIGNNTPTSVTLGSSIITLIPSNVITATCWSNTATSTSLTFNVGTSTVKIIPTINANININYPEGQPFYILHYSPAGSYNLTVQIPIAHTLTIHQFIDDGPSAHTLTFTARTAGFILETVPTFSGHAGALISLRSTSPGTQFLLNKTNLDPVSADYLNIRDSWVVGGTPWQAGIHSIDNGNNTGWNFASAAASITPSLYTNTNTFYTIVVIPQARSITPTLYTNNQTFYTAVVKGIAHVTPALFNNAQTFYTPIVVSGIFVPFYTNTNTIFTPVVGRSPYPITPTLYTNTNTIFNGVVATFAKITPLRYDNSQTFYTAVITQGAGQIHPSLVVNDQIIYYPVLTGGIQQNRINPTLFSNTSTFYTSIVNTNYHVGPLIYTNTNTFYTPVRTSTVGVSTTRFDNPQTFFSPTVAATPHAIRPAMFINTQTIFQPAMHWITKENNQSFIVGLG